MLPGAGGLDSTPGQGTWPHLPQLKIPHAKTKTQYSQVNKNVPPIKPINYINKYSKPEWNIWEPPSILELLISKPGWKLIDGPAGGSWRGGWGSGNNFSVTGNQTRDGKQVLAEAQEEWVDSSCQKYWPRHTFLAWPRSSTFADLEETDKIDEWILMVTRWTQWWWKLSLLKPSRDSKSNLSSLKEI